MRNVAMCVCPVSLRLRPLQNTRIEHFWSSEFVSSFYLLGVYMCVCLCVHLHSDSNETNTNSEQCERENWCYYYPDRAGGELSWQFFFLWCNFRLDVAEPFTDKVEKCERNPSNNINPTIWDMLRSLYYFSLFVFHPHSQFHAIFTHSHLTFGAFGVKVQIYPRAMDEP